MSDFYFNDPMKNSIFIDCIKKLERQLDELHAAAKAYFDGYVQDEADDPECCSKNQHELALALKHAIANIETVSLPAKTTETNEQK